jgi:hypothetical protein
MRRDKMPKKRGYNYLTSLNIEGLIGIMEHMARVAYDGHYTIMAFTTGYKAGFGTPNLDGLGREQVWNIPSQETLKGALVRAIMSDDQWLIL